MTSKHSLIARTGLACLLGVLFCIQSPTVFAAKRAANDKVTTTKGTKVKANVTKNDSGFNKKSYKVKVVKKPKKGKATVGKDKRITYTPNSKFVGKDTLVYRLTDNKGFKKTATLTITVKNKSTSTSKKKSKSSSGGGFGTDSADGRRLTLQWKPNPLKVDGYVILFGTKKTNVILQVADISVKKGTLDPNSPSAVFYSASDLGVGVGDNACFRVRAYSGNGTSTLSNPLCKRIQ